MKLEDFKIGELVKKDVIGKLYNAVSKDSGQSVQIRLVHASYSQLPDFERSFRESLEKAASLTQEGILRVLGHDIGDYGAYIITQATELSPLSDIISKLGSLPALEATSFVQELAVSIRAVHIDGFVHGTLMPQNIYVDDNLKQICIGGWGLGPLFRLLVANKVDAVRETLPYLSPEMTSSNAAPQRQSDIYSLGVIFYRLLVGTVPWGEQDVRTFYLNGERPSIIPPSLQRLEVPDILDDVILDLLEPALDRRCPNLSMFIKSISEAKADIFASFTPTSTLLYQPDRLTPIELPPLDLTESAGTEEDAGGQHAVLSPEGVRDEAPAQQEQSPSHEPEDKENLDTQIFIPSSGPLIMIDADDSDEPEAEREEGDHPGGRGDEKEGMLMPSAPMDLPAGEISTKEEPVTAEHSDHSAVSSRFDIEADSEADSSQHESASISILSDYRVDLLTKAGIDNGDANDDEQIIDDAQSSEESDDVFETSPAVTGDNLPDDNGKSPEPTVMGSPEYPDETSQNGTEIAAAYTSQQPSTDEPNGQKGLEHKHPSDGSAKVKLPDTLPVVESPAVESANDRDHKQEQPSHEKDALVDFRQGSPNGDHAGDVESKGDSTKSTEIIPNGDHSQAPDKQTEKRSGPYVEFPAEADEEISTVELTLPASSPRRNQSLQFGVELPSADDQNADDRSHPTTDIKTVELTQYAGTDEGTQTVELERSYSTKQSESTGGTNRELLTDRTEETAPSNDERVLQTSELKTEKVTSSSMISSFSAIQADEFADVMSAMMPSIAGHNLRIVNGHERVASPGAAEPKKTKPKETQKKVVLSKVRDVEPTDEITEHSEEFRPAFADDEDFDERTATRTEDFATTNTLDFFNRGDGKSFNGLAKVLLMTVLPLVLLYFALALAFDMNIDFRKNPVFRRLSKSNKEQIVPESSPVRTNRRPTDSAAQRESEPSQRPTDQRNRDSGRQKPRVQAPNAQVRPPRQTDGRDADAGNRQALPRARNQRNNPPAVPNPAALQPIGIRWTVTVRSNTGPEVADVFIDGELKGRTNQNGQLTLTNLIPNTYILKVQKAGFELWGGQITISNLPNQTQNIQLVSAAVRVPNSNLGSNGPVANSARLRNAGQQRATNLASRTTPQVLRTPRPAAEQRTRPAPRDGRINVQIGNAERISDVEIYVNGRLHEGPNYFAPAQIALPSGTYLIELRKNGYFSAPPSQSVNILDGETRTVTFFLTAQ